MVRDRDKSAKKPATRWKTTALTPAGYAELLEDIKTRLRAAQVKATVAVNREMIVLYWGIGRDILRRQGEQGWGAKVIDRLGDELRRAFPSLKGLSPRNLKYMRAFAEAYPDEPFVQQVAAQIPWFHHCILLDKVKVPDVRVWYVHKTIENGWSRNVLIFQIDSRLHERQGKAISNFERTLPASQSDLAAQLLKDPYTFDFLTLAEDARERELAQGLLAHIRQFLLELGVGFAFVGSQYPLEVSGQDFFLDLLFYHCKLHCYFVIELKMEEFQPEHAGKMNFYLSAVDDLVRDKAVDRPTLGLILCRKQNKLIAEYALRDIAKPIGVAGFETRLAESLPKELEDKLPTIEKLEDELGKLSTPQTEEDDTLGPRNKKTTTSRSSRR